MKSKTNVKFRSIFNYLSTIFSWALFVILGMCAVLLVYYFICLKTNKDSRFVPPFSIYTIVSGSMIPTINVYDVIINLKVDDPTDIKKDDVITFISTSSISEGKTVTHRVIEVQNINGEYQYVTKGDNNPTPDTSAALYSNLIGRAVVRLPKLGKVQFFVGSKVGWIVVVILPALYVIIKDILKIIKVTKYKNAADMINNKLSEKDKNVLNNDNNGIINSEGDSNENK